ncbi:hypothetical protein [Candidatus Fonsibacter ubiquis]|uniref:hypothetical protein n=1 Tax=Candidatus Fonsibacter ubiquis TaxID=1925548 RepID=UPI000C0792A5|nr:hypothetical protein [Candidatus Fonsibacter ubiquis]
MQNISNIINFLIDFFFKKKIICLINAPQQYFSLVELIEKKKINEKELSIYIGYCSKSSQDQIKHLIKNYYYVGNFFFLAKIFNENIFLIILNFFKMFGKQKSIIIVGDYKYYLFKPIYRNSKNIIFLDEGISLLTFDNMYSGNKNFELFSVFSHLVKDNNNLNEYAYLKKKFKDKVVKIKTIFILGTHLSSFEDILNKDFYIKKINSFAEKNIEFEIFYIPHRNEKDFNKDVLFKNIKVQTIDRPVELFLADLPFLPEIIAGFYSMALINFSIILKNIKILNLSLSDDVYNTTYHKKNFEEFKKIFNSKNIQNVNL